MGNVENSSPNAMEMVSASTQTSTSEKKITKKQLLRMIDDLKKNPNDKVRILGDAGVTLVGAGLGAAAAGTIASALGATSIFGVTTVAGWLGVTAVAATPVGWVIGAAAAGAGLAYGISRIVHGGGLSEGRKLELLQKYKEEVKDMEAKEVAGTISEEDKNSFIISMRELIDKEAIDPEEARALIEYVENGVIPLSQAFETVHALLAESGPIK